LPHRGNLTLAVYFSARSAFAYITLVAAATFEPAIQPSLTRRNHISSISPCTEVHGYIQQPRGG
jgi:hypothetical protein